MVCLERSPKIVQHAVSQQLSQELRDGTYRWIIEADNKSFFDEMDQDWLCEMLAQRIDDRALLGLIRKWLQAGVLEPGANQIEEPEAGTPLGRKAERTGRSTMAIGS